ncbi:Ig-like domain-containing protein [Spirochaetia bacterium 38H-sp]|uniref:Ig-like domain-containing protein n=1 Tax=Rarispira pelagica TaxID=3141764 RepID=A0ABU9U8U1_9SPIR
MKPERLLIILCLLVAFLFPAFAGGETEWQEVDGKENWKKSIDIKESKPGTYNVIIKGTDFAGNEFIEGPYNLVIDPDSDLAISRVISPANNQTIRNNINIIGIAVDDDGISRVEVKIDEGPYRQAEGTDYWNMYVDATTLKDGEHTITVRAIDINGLPGTEYTSTFLLDTEPPQMTIDSHKNGALVSKKIVIKGTVKDANQVKSLSATFPSYTVKKKDKEETIPETTQNVKIKYDKNENIYSFELPIETQKLPDGPMVLWFKATDMTGTESAVPFLIFIDNKEPEISIISPEEESPVYGMVQITGTINDAIGVKRMWYTYNKEEKDIPLTPGNPYWTIQFDVSEDTTGTIETIIFAEDVSGNITNKKIKLKNDREGAKPAITIITPQTEEKTVPVLTKYDAIIGITEGINPQDKIVVEGLGEGPQEFPAKSGFYIPLSGLSPGKYNINITAVDSLGFESKPLKYSFEISADKPILIPTELVYQDTQESQSWNNGLLYDASRKAVIRGTIKSETKPSGGKLYTGADIWTALPSDLSAQPDIPKTASESSLKISPTEEANTYTFEASLPQKAGNGSLPAIFVINNADKSISVFPQIISYQAPPPAKGKEQIPPAKPNQLLILDYRINKGNILLTDKTPLGLYFSGNSISAVSVEPQEAENLISVKKIGNHVLLTAKSSGEVSGFSIIVKDKSGKEYKTPTYKLTVDLGLPSFTISSPVANLYTNQEIILSGTAQDDLAVASLQYRIDGLGKWNSIILTDNSFETTISSSALKPGAHILEVRAIDKAGNISVKRQSFFFDATAPKIAFITPRSQDKINGTIRVTGIVSSESPIESVTYSTDGGETKQNVSLSNNMFTLLIDFTSLAREEKILTFTTQDKAGNIQDIELKPNIDFAKDIPVVQIQTPEEASTITTDVTVSGMVFDDDGIDRIYWRLDENQWQEIPAEHNFAINLPISSLTDNEHTIQIYAKDIFGIESEPVTRTIRVSLKEPEAILTSPTVDTTIKGSIELKGTAFDNNGMDSILLSLDNGTSYKKAELNVEGTEWTYPLDTTLLKDGTYAIQILARDAYGIEASYSALINIDNTPPELNISSPEEAANAAGKLKLSGRVSDNIDLQSFIAEIEPINNAKETKTIELPTDNIINQEIDLSNLEPGWYNIRITAQDKAGNTSITDRNLNIVDQLNNSSVRILFPEPGSTVHGPVTVSGIAVSSTPVEKAQLYVGDRFIDAVTVDTRGYFSYTIDPKVLTDGEIIIKAAIAQGDNNKTESNPVKIMYQKLGPYISITSHNMGALLSNRPWIEGIAGYNSNLDPENPDDKKKLKELEVKKLEVSLDNGRTFTEIAARENWKYRVETGMLQNGPLPIIIKATYKNGEVAVERTLFIVDKIYPVVKLLNPQEGNYLNTEAEFIGTAEDNFGIKDIQISLREGDKAGYEIPQFIQGMYLDAHFLGMTYYKVGLGLTFFDNNVKLQASYGIGPQTTEDGKSARLSGQFISGKLLASLFYLPFESILGPDWDWLSLKVALGADFSYIILYNPITVESATGTNTINTVVLSAIIGQLEFPIVEVKGFQAFHTYSLYAEPEVWFIPSDVDPKIVPKITFGLHTVIF